jgi:hypothetical protein
MISATDIIILSRFLMLLYVKTETVFVRFHLASWLQSKYENGKQ